MHMIDVMKRLAELDASNPTVAQPTLKQQQSLATVSNIEADKINECGPMGMDMGRPSTPASFSINASAESGDEVASMLTQIMNLAGVKPASSIGDLDHDGDHDMGDHGIELGSPGPLEIEPGNGRDGMADIIGMVDRMNGPSDDNDDDGSQSPVAKMADEVEGMTAELKDEGIGAGFDSATTTPDEKIQQHKYGNDQVTPKPKEPAKVNGGGNPYTESVEQVSLQLLKAYEAFKNGQ